MSGVQSGTLFGDREESDSPYAATVSPGDDVVFAKGTTLRSPGSPSGEALEVPEGLITTQEQYDEMLFVVSEAPVVAVDTETTGLHPYAGDVLRGVCVATQDRSWYLSVTHPDSVNFPVDPFIFTLNDSAKQRVGERRGQEQVYAHATYDWSVLTMASEGRFNIPERHWDVQIIDWLLNENARSHTLKDIGARLFGIDAKAEQKAIKALKDGRKASDIYRELRNGDDPQWTERGTAKAARAEAKRLAEASKKTWETFTAADLAAYGMQDARLTFDIREWQLAELGDPWDAEVDVRPAIRREFRFQRALWRMIRTGIKVDPDIAARHMETAEQIILDIEARWPDLEFSKTAKLGEYLYRDLGMRVPKRSPKTGVPSTDKESLEELEGEHPVIEDILQWRKMSKALGTYFGPLVNKTGVDGRVHSAFNQARTVTGRLSSSDPNLQNIPTSFSAIASVREVFVAAEGYELWEYDLSQAELRVAASYAKEQWLIDAIERGDDLHSIVAHSIFQPDITLEQFMEKLEAGDKETKRQRGIGKNANYSFQYGVGPKKFAMYLVSGTGNPITAETIQQAREILDGYRAQSPALTRLMNNLGNVAGQKGWIPLHVPGRYRRYKGPGYHDRKTYTALNAIVQGGVAEFLKDIMLAVEPFVFNLGGRICLQIHDSLVMELAPGTGDLIASRLQSITDQINPFSMPMVWDTKLWSASE